MAGMNAAVVGLLASVWLTMAAPSALHSGADVAWFLAGWWAFSRARWPAWAVMLLVMGAHLLWQLGSRLLAG